jgi:hypothetical protein
VLSWIRVGTGDPLIGTPHADHGMFSRAVGYDQNCGAICPSFNRGCYSCYGPMESPDTLSVSTQFRILGQSDEQIARAFRGFNVRAWQFRKASEECERS